ncbi:hypothetical protein TRAPUB_9154 [Trametes pubescens]|uniref:Uncharacterized protein n=1 Tax=Trametes pubescens TaxID=154538 RepID=A0A1M2W353_TRAPU|nr:hypothetical protein TRAPUB_9154 [Trametes pubescens]
MAPLIARGSVNAHAEELRQYFVAHEEKKTLVVEDVGTRYSVDFGRLARLMTDKIHENVVDGTLVEWILPDFTTTTLKDTTICSILMMSTLKQFFTYRMCITCGIPSITLEGTRDDWERVLKRIDRLYDLGDEPSAWANMLRPILGRFVSAFDTEPDVEFWKHVVYRDQPMCGRDDMSGWLTAFCVWSHEGTWKAGPLEPLLAISKGVQSGDDRKAEEGRATGSVLSLRSPQRRWVEYTLDGVPYFTIAIGSIPAGYCEVDVTLDDNGKVFDCMMVAGHVASAWSSSPNAGPDAFDTISPAPQRFMFVKA